MSQSYSLRALFFNLLDKNNVYPSLNYEYMMFFCRNENVDQLAFDLVDFKNNVSENLAVIQSMLQKQDEEIKVLIK